MVVGDPMGPLRPVVDRAVLVFALSHTIAPGDFMIIKWGGYRLNPQMAKTVAAGIADTKADYVVRTFSVRMASLPFPLFTKKTPVAAEIKFHPA